MRKALVIGANGQDGSFLVRHLLARKYQVVGIGRQLHSRWNISSALFSYRQVDLEAEGQLSDVLEAYKPDCIFHVAAVHTSAGGSYEPMFDSVLKVNVASVHTVLEYLRSNPGGRFSYASSAKVFGSPQPARIDESTPIANQCLYSISKNTAYHLIDYYRQNHGVNASVLYLFNHESELRPAGFFIPKVLGVLANSLKDNSFASMVNTLDFYCDWGSAEEYMDIMIDVLERAPSEDFVLAKGECTYAMDLVAGLFSRYGLDYKSHFQQTTSQAQPANPYKVDIGKLNRTIGRVPLVTIEELCVRILNSVQQ